MNFFREDLRQIKAFVFDVDGVLSVNELVLHPSGDMMRTANTRDGFAIQVAVRSGFPVAVITGARSEAIRKRFNDLGVDDVYLSSSDKVADLMDFLGRRNLVPEDILYMGDDLPDYGPMKLAGLPTCPNDASSEIQAIARYISDYPGGRGCVRDVIEQVLRSQGFWPTF